MIKHDYKTELRTLYSAKVGAPVVVEVPSLNFIMVNGAGDPNTSPEYAHAIEALYPVAYKLKFMSKLELGEDYVVMPLEGLWWAKDMAAFSSADKSQWQWTAMIMQPNIITPEMFERARADVALNKRPSAIDKVRLDTYSEGRAAQVMYVGPYADEGPTIEALHAFIAEQGGSLDGAKNHHEIYLGDPRRTPPAKLKTIIRQPF